MKVNRWATFLADFPDDRIDGDNDVIRYGGQGVTAAIGELLTGLGCKVSDPIDAQEHGWELNVETNGRHLWCQVTDLGYFILGFDDTSIVDKFMQKRNPTYIEMIKKLSIALNEDPRFHDIKWHSDADGPHPDSPYTLGPVVE